MARERQLCVSISSAFITLSSPTLSFLRFEIATFRGFLFYIEIVLVNSE